MIRREDRENWEVAGYLGSNAIYQPVSAPVRRWPTPFGMVVGMVVLAVLIVAIIFWSYAV